MDYVKVDQAVIDDANRQIAAANKVRPFVPAGPLPDSERVGFVTVNWGSMKTVMAEQSAILQKNTMTASDVRTANGG